MEIRWRLALPTIGLALFAAVTAQSIRNQPSKLLTQDRYFWWSIVRLDPYPLREVPRTAKCENPQGCAEWDPLELRAKPRPLARVVLISGLPAYLVEAGLLVGLSELGANQIWTFMVSMPLLLAAWYYFIGLLLDRRRRTQVAKSSSQAVL